MKWIITGLLLLAVFSAHASADTITRSFKARGTVSPGFVVAITKDDLGTVEAAPASDPNRIYGVVVDKTAAPVTLQKNNEQTFVATSGSYPVLTSTQNGSVKSGDYLTLSSAGGIAAKASSKSPYVVGQALESFDGSQGTTDQVAGHTVGKVQARIRPGKNPLTQMETGIPGFLRRLAEVIAGKPLSPVRIYIALLIFLLSSLLAASLIYVGVRSSLIAIGRNPLSKHAILQGLAQVIIAAILVFASSLFGIFLLLKI
ncbi:hypothetical protein HYW36_00485 [Candidatus Saccharibacteria bacterium]|nr:hypothetical protein [Candidatus Saccharibacteria bacterium]